MAQYQIPLLMSLLLYTGYVVTAQLIQLDTTCTSPGCDVINLTETKMTLIQLVAKVDLLEKANLKHEQDKHDLREQIEELQQENEHIKLQLSSLQEGHNEEPVMVAFRAVSNKPPTKGSEGKIITYTAAPVNIGGALNAATGVVTITTKGVYWISFWALASGTHTSRVDIEVNGKDKMYGHSGNAHTGNNQYMVGNAGLLVLDRGDKVAVRHAWGIVQHPSPYTQFSGYLVYPL